jgi:dipeptide/tripeptide permease
MTHVNLQQRSPMFPTALQEAQHEVIPTKDALDRAGEILGYIPSRVDEVRMVLRMTPIFLLTILYWTIYSQMASVFVIQAQYMDRNIAVGSRVYRMPAASMAMFDTFAIIVMIPIYDGIIVPLLKHMRLELTLLQRIGWGFVLAVAAMLAAAVVERNRLAAIAQGGNVTVMQQVTPYLLIGASEVLSSIGQIEFFYDQVRVLLFSFVGACGVLVTCHDVPPRTSAANQHFMDELPWRHDVLYCRLPT